MHQNSINQSVNHHDKDREEDTIVTMRMMMMVVINHSANYDDEVDQSCKRLSFLVMKTKDVDNKQCHDNVN